MRRLDSRGWLVLTLTAALSFGAIAPLQAGEVVFDESCFPTCDETDGRFLILAGGEALDTLTDEALRLKFSVDKNTLPASNRFLFEVFDGDVLGTDGAGGSHWDVSPSPAVEVSYRLFAIETLLDGTQIETLVPDAKIFPAAGAAINPLSSTQMFDNAWFGVEVEVGPEAQVAGSGNYLYALEIERDTGYVFEPGEGLLNAFKVRTDGSVFLSLLEEPFAFEAKWASGLYDIPIIYPAFNPLDPFNPANLVETTYPGSFKFNLKVGAPATGVTRTSLTIYDGDLDHGNSQGGDRDTDDADISYPVPCVFGMPGCPLPFQIGAGARSEGVAFSVKFPLATGSPPDDLIGGIGLFNRREPSVEYRIDFPVNGDPGTIQCRVGESAEGPTVDGRRSILNLNPSGNREWESFVLSTDPFDPSVMDCHVDSIPSGVYRVELVGMDMNNLNAWFFGEDVCGAEPDGTPFCPFGEYLVGDTVWEDTDGDGNGDPAEIAADGEFGIQGVIVRVVDGDGRELGRTLTDANGQYEFAVSPGEYTVEVVPENFAAVGASGAVGDRVWLDADRGGDQDAGEPGIPGVTVELWSAGGDGLVGGGDDVQLDSAVTDLDGRYLFSGLPPGSYYTLVLDETVPDGLALTGGTDPSAVRTIVSNEVYLDLDFGYGSADPALAVIGDRVWHDLNSDGVQDPGEPGIDGVTVQLLDGVGDPVTTVVTEGGFYLFTGLTPGTYEVDVTDNYGALAGYTLTTANDPTGQFPTMAGEAVLDKDFGYFRAGLYSVSDFVWYDADRDGVFDVDETGLVGVTVSLVGSDGITMATTTTAADGSFSFSGLLDGAYALVIGDVDGVLNGLLPTTRGALDGSTGFKIVGANVSGINFGYVAGGALADMLATTESPTQNNEVVDENVLTYDFGYRGGDGSLGDTVFIDNDRDGIYEPGLGEAGVPGVVVELYDGNGQLQATAITVAGGFYLFENLRQDSYTVVVAASNFAPGGALFGYFPVSDYDGFLDNQTDYALAAFEEFLLADFGYLLEQQPGTGTPGYWKNHPDDWPVDEITIGGVTWPKQGPGLNAINILKRAEKEDGKAKDDAGDKTFTLAAALITATLNALNGNDTSCISDVMLAANEWLEEYPVNSGVRGSSEAWSIGEPLYLAMDDYNNGRLPCADARD